MDPSQRDPEKELLLKPVTQKISEHEKKVREAVSDAVERTSATFREWEEGLQRREAEISRKQEELQQDRLKFEAAVNATRLANDQERKNLLMDVERAREAFEEDRRRMMSDHIDASDIVGLNMGGEKTVQVKRSLLTQFDGSFLASMFSGRWEDQITRDKDGNTFFDEPPEVMMPLVEWLRECRDATPEHPAEAPVVDIKYQKSWARMLHRFGLVTDAKELTKVSNGSLPDRSWFWYMTSSDKVVFKYKKRCKGAEWTQFTQSVQEGPWWRSDDWTRGNEDYDIAVWVDGVQKHTWTGV